LAGATETGVGVLVGTTGTLLIMEDIMAGAIIITTDIITITETIVIEVTGLTHTMLVVEVTTTETAEGLQLVDLELQTLDTTIAGVLQTLVQEELIVPL